MVYGFESEMGVNQKITISFLGFVAVVVGGPDEKTTSEVYSPNGKCQHKLPNIPFDGLSPVLALINETVFACNPANIRSPHFGCWILDIKNYK